MKPALLIVLFGMLNGCDVAEDIVRSKAHPTQQDQVRLVRLQQEFGRDFNFSFEDVYLRARHRTGSATREEAINVYRAFWLDHADKPRADSNLVYLNVYDHSGRFQFQVYWEPTQRSLSFSQSEHY